MFMTKTTRAVNAHPPPVSAAYLRGRRTTGPIWRESERADQEIETLTQRPGIADCAQKSDSW
jgi:hypothetical protein